MILEGYPIPLPTCISLHRHLLPVQTNSPDRQGNMSIAHSPGNCSLINTTGLNVMTDNPLNRTIVLSDGTVICTAATFNPAPPCVRLLVVDIESYRHNIATLHAHCQLQ